MNFSPFSLGITHTSGKHVNLPFFVIFFFSLLGLGLNSEVSAVSLQTTGLERPHHLNLWPIFKVEKSYPTRMNADIFWPLFHLKKEGSSFSYSIRPLLWYRSGYSGPHKNRRMYLFPVTYYRHWQNFSSDANRMVEWSNNERTFLVFPVVGYNNRLNTSSQRYYYDTGTTVAGINTGTPNKTISSSTVQVSAEKTIQFGNIFYTRSKIDRTFYLDNSTSVVNLKNTVGFSIFPLYSYSRDHKMPFLSHLSLLSVESYNDQRNWSLKPLIWASKDPRSKNYTTTLFPIYWNIRRNESYFKSIFPLFYDMGSGDSRVSILAPVLFYKRSPSDSFLIAFNYARLRGEGYSYQSVFPFVWGKNVSNEVFRGIMPLAWSWRSPTTTYDVLFPVYRYRRDSVREEKDFLSPFFQYSSKPGYDAMSVFPIFFDHRQTGGRHSIYLLPFYWTSSRKGDHEYKFFSPFFQARRVGVYHTKSVIPVFWHEYTYAGGKERFYLFPFYKSTEGNELTFISPYLQYERNASYSRTSMFPLWSRTLCTGKGASWFVLPVYYSYAFDDSAYNFISPILQMSKAPGVERTSIFPLFWDERTSNGRRNIFIIPCYLSLSYKGQGTYRFLSPVWQMKREQYSSQTSILPIYRNKIYGDGYSFFLFPVYTSSRHNHQTRHFSLIPLFHYYHNGAYKQFISLPGITWSSRSEDDKRFNFYLLLTSYRRSSQSDYTFRFFWKIFFIQKRGGSKKVQFNPLFNYEKDNDGSYFAILGRFLTFEKYQGHRTVRFLHFIRFRGK